MWLCFRVIGWGPSGITGCCRSFIPGQQHCSFGTGLWDRFHSRNGAVHFQTRENVILWLLFTHSQKDLTRLPRASNWFRTVIVSTTSGVNSSCRSQWHSEGKWGQREFSFLAFPFIQPELAGGGRMEEENILRYYHPGSSCHANYRWSTALSCKMSCVISNHYHWITLSWCRWTWIKIKIERHS